MGWACRWWPISFAAIEQRVVNEKRLSWEQLAEALHSDHQLAGQRCPRRTCAPDAQEHPALWHWRHPGRCLGQTHLRAVYAVGARHAHPVRLHHSAGLFSHGGIAQYGADLAATPNGRHAGAPISHSANPDPGFLPDGGGALTAKANAVAAVQPGWGNSAPLRTPAARCHCLEVWFGALSPLRTHNQQGGTLVNLNIVSKDKILEAHRDPSKYPDLMVRVTGYSAYFYSLSPTYRQQIVDRLLA